MYCLKVSVSPFVVPRTLTPSETITPTQIRMARAALGWELKQLASRVGISPQTAARIESGRCKTPSTISNIRAVFEEVDLIFLNEDGLRSGVLVSHFKLNVVDDQTS